MSELVINEASSWSEPFFCSTEGPQKESERGDISFVYVQCNKLVLKMIIFTWKYQTWTILHCLISACNSNHIPHAFVR